MPDTLALAQLQVKAGCAVLVLPASPGRTNQGILRVERAAIVHGGWGVLARSPVLRHDLLSQPRPEQSQRKKQ